MSNVGAMRSRVVSLENETTSMNRLYVGNLSFQSTEDDLHRAFAAFGEVNEVKIVMDRETGRSRGFAFVTMADENGAREAVARLDGSQLGGRALRVNEAQPREGGGGGGRGGGGGGRDGGSRRSW